MVTKAVVAIAFIFAYFSSAPAHALSPRTTFVVVRYVVVAGRSAAVESRVSLYVRQIALRRSGYRVIDAGKASTDDLATATANVADAVKSESSKTFKFSVLSGKLSLGTFKKFSRGEMDLGEINVYKVLVPGVGAVATVAHFGWKPCYKAAYAILNEIFKFEDFKAIFDKTLKEMKPDTSPLGERI